VVAKSIKNFNPQNLVHYDEVNNYFDSLCSRFTTIQQAGHHVQHADQIVCQVNNFNDLRTMHTVMTIDAAETTPLFDALPENIKNPGTIVTDLPDAWQGTGSDMIFTETVFEMLMCNTLRSLATCLVPTLYVIFHTPAQAGTVMGWVATHLHHTTTFTWVQTSRRAHGTGASFDSCHRLFTVGYRIPSGYQQRDFWRFQPEAEKSNVIFGPPIPRPKLQLDRASSPYTTKQLPVRLINWIMEHLAPVQRPVWDLLCGTGGVALSAALNGCNSMSFDKHVEAIHITKKRLQAVSDGGTDYYDTQSSFLLFYDYLDGLQQAFVEHFDITDEELNFGQPEDLCVNRSTIAAPSPGTTRAAQTSAKAAAQLAAQQIDPAEMQMILDSAAEFNPEELQEN
jgi:hypothetical protein